MFRTWWQKVFVSPRGRTARRAGCRPPARLLGRTTRLSMTALEDRITPAFNMTLSLNATVGVTTATVAGTTTFTATATGANLQWQDLFNAFVAGNNVVVNSGSAGTEAGNITDLTGNQLPGLPGNQTLTFQSGTGAGLVGNITLQDVNLQGANESIVVSANGSVVTGVLSAGTFLAPTKLANATITAATGSISEGGIFQGPIFATNLALSAATGVGTAGPTLPTQATNLVARTASGGIVISNTGALNVGFTGDPFQGVQVTGASGTIQIDNSGSLTVSELVKAPGSITLNANGATSDATIQAGVDGVFSTGATATIHAGRNLTLGTPVLFGDVHGQGVVLDAGGDIVVDNRTLVNADGAAGTLATAGGDFKMLHAILNSSRLAANGTGPISIQTGAGHTFTLDSGLGGAIATNGGNITISADDMVINDGINTSGVVTLQQAGTTARPIDLGLGTTPNSLGLSAAELTPIGAGSVIIGRADNAGSITLTAPITPTGTNTLTLTTGGSILDGTAGEQADITVANLTMNAGVAVGAGGNGDIDIDVATLNAGRTNAAAGVTMFISETFAGTVKVGQIDGGAGNVTLSSSAGPITSVNPNDGVAEVIGNVVTLDASATPSNGNTGQIGFFTASAQFFEVDANTLFAFTNNSRLWIRDVGAGATVGMAIGQVSAGNNTAFLQAAHGDITSAAVDGNPDVLADTVNLRALNGGNIGTSGASPLEISATNLNAAVQVGAGGIHVKDTAGGVNVVLAQTVNGAVDLEAAGAAANMVLTTLAAPGNIVTLNATGAVTGTAGGTADVAATSLAITAGAGIGTAANPLETAVANLAFNNAGGLVNVANTGPLTINAVGTLLTSSNTGTSTTLSAASPLTFAVNTTSAGSLTATAVETNDPGTFADKLTVNAGVTVESTGGNVVLQAGDDVVLNTGSLVKSDVGFVTLTAAFGDLDNEGGVSMGAGAVQAGSDITVSARDDITVSTLTANAATGTVTITSTAGNIFDDGNDATLIAGNALILSAVRSIGQPGATPDIDTAVNTLSATTTGAGPFAGAPTPGIWVTDTNDLTVTTATTGDGVILIDAGGNLIAQAVTANGTGRNVRLRALGGDLTVGTITAAGDIVALSATGAIVDGNAAANNVTALSLSLSAGTGIATPADPLETTVSNVAWSAGTGGIDLINTGALTITSVTAFGATVTGGTGNGAATVTAASPLTVASDVVMGGDITLTASETNDPGTFADVLTVNAGVTVRSTGGNVTLQAGDDVVLNNGSIVQADTAGKTVTLTAAFGDLDNEGAIVINGADSIVATNLALMP